MKDMNRLNTVRTDRLMSPLETEIAARNLMDVETTIKYRRETPVGASDYVLALLPVGILVLTFILVLLGVGS